MHEGLFSVGAVPFSFMGDIDVSQQQSVRKVGRTDYYYIVLNIRNQPYD